jgi:dienelactone hydrolase
VCAVLFSSAGVAHGATLRLAAPSNGPFAVGEIVMRFTDHSRFVTIPRQGSVPRPLLTEIRYPALGDPSRTDVHGATPDRSSGPFPLIVFAHGYNITPDPYAQLLDAWARAGYVVAAPIFPLTNANAPGGANRSDLFNEPTDMSYVITRVLVRSAARRGFLSRLVNAHEIAVSGQSDGGSTALAVAYNSAFADRRIGAAMIFSGAELGVGAYTFPAPTPPLLAVQGTADTSNAPASTYHFFGAAPQPKYLLSLLGAGHLPPYTSQQPQLGIVERVTVAFLDRYLKRINGSAARMGGAGNVAGVATLTS